MYLHCRINPLKSSDLFDINRVFCTYEMFNRIQVSAQCVCYDTCLFKYFVKELFECICIGNCPAKANIFWYEKYIQSSDNVMRTAFIANRLVEVRATNNYIIFFICTGNCSSAKKLI